ncbi:hypothetical protein B1B04_10345 [Lysinibacillus sp. KCTC 33748]|uniref:site-specific integrase n=1 Tax=unclassified Lysinibacillus TaxID=2636778 RepID=UPI0009A8A6BB|nr:MULTISPECIES: site-specific integrase [unclassified Lysinibacillus]OXS74005.1 hypothetical protein B1B04_10345 [Lysinibacillus sp. KCTC 33748]SKB69056.1 AP2-like DNA-binding integrase domain-containing protein [Lysinibacillus sp. AC-3]
MTEIKSYKLKNGTIRYQFQIYLGTDSLTGNEKRTTKRGFKTAKEAEIELKRLQYQIANGEIDFAPKKIEDKFFEEIYEDWLMQYQNTVQLSTLGKTKSIFKNHILPTFRSLKIRFITVDFCQKFANTLPKKLKKFKDVLNYTSLVLEYAKKRDYIEKNPMEYIDRPKPLKKINENVEEEFLEGNYYSAEELTNFLEALKKEPIMKFTFFNTLAHTGMRKGEAFALKWKDIDFENSCIRINKALSYCPTNGLYIKETKNGKPRAVLIDKDTLSFLEQWKKEQRILLKEQNLKALNDTNQLVFSNTLNAYVYPSKTNQWIKSIQRRHNLRQITTHGLRHTHCTLLLEAGVTPREVMERLGHMDLEITLKIYAHVTAEAKSRAAEKYIQYLQK